MKRSRFGEEQMIAVLKEQEAGMPTADVCRRHGISSATFYKWKSNYGGLEVSDDARRLRQLEQENAQLKKLLAGSMLDNAMLREISAKSSDARCRAWTERRCATSAAALTTLRRGHVSGNWPASAAGSAIGACTGCPCREGWVMNHKKFRRL